MAPIQKAPLRSGPRSDTKTIGSLDRFLYLGCGNLHRSQTLFQPGAILRLAILSLASRRGCDVLDGRAYRTRLEKFVARGWQKHRIRLEKTSHRVGRNVASGWKSGSHPVGKNIASGWNNPRTRLESNIAPGWRSPRTWLEETSHPVGKIAVVIN